MQSKDPQEPQTTKDLGMEEANKRDLSTGIGEAVAQLSLNQSTGSAIRGTPSSALPAGLEDTKHSVVSQPSLLSALRSSPDVPQKDLKRCLSMCTSLSLADQDRVEWMMQSPKLLEWLNAPRSQTLLINGNGESNEVFSSTTFLSAKLLECLGQIGPIISHHFFCSLHTSSRASSKDDATGLVKSFVCQLLIRDMSWDLSFLSQKHLEKIGSGDLETIFMLFQKLVQQLPNKIFLFWMIDGINYYERSQWRPDFLKVIPELLEIIRGCNDVVIKLLLTCHGKSSFVKDALEKDDILTAPFDVDGSCQGWSERAFQRMIGPEIEKLKAATQNIGTVG